MSREQLLARDGAAQIVVVLRRRTVRKLAIKRAQFQRAMREFFFLDGKANTESSPVGGVFERSKTFA
jgi:hypothetical protein